MWSRHKTYQRQNMFLVFFVFGLVLVCMFTRLGYLMMFRADHYGVQAKAGSLSGTATSNITEITNQINMGFNVPYKMVSGEDVYITKMIVAISGHYTDNAQAIIQTSVDKYKFANIIFLSKKELENHHVMVE